jgi:uncharacterized protein
MAFYMSALTLGLLSSFHCAGMCGPIALMLPGNTGSKTGVIAGRFIYNSGRIFTYLLLGLLSGLLGFTVALKGFQKELSIITGSVILLTLLISTVSKNWLGSFRGSAFISGVIRKKLKILFAKKTRVSLFLTGVLNGLLPCGFVYLAIAGAAASASVTGGIAYMLLFGLGTFPVMMMVSLAGNFFGTTFRKSFLKVSFVVALFLGVFLIYRGTEMNTDACAETHSVTHPVGFCPVPTSK